MYRGEFLRRGWRLVLGAIAALVGIAVAVVTLYVYHAKLSHTRRDLYIGGFLIAAGLWFMLDERYFSLLLPYPGLVRQVRTLCLCAMPLLLMRYLLPLTTGARFRHCWRTLLAAMSLLVLLMILRCVGVISLSAQTPFLLLAILLSTGLYTVCLLRECRSEPANRRVCLPFFILFGGFALDAVSYLLWLHTLGDLFAVAFAAYATLQIAALMRGLRDGVERTRDYAQLEGELAQSRISVMLSQIKPHFLFNTLNTISALCLTDPLLADQAITSLSNYLRGNIRSLEQTSPVPFLTELDQIKYYARLEQMRFGDKLRVVYSIGFSDFLVPTLSLQTLVENAIRHGLGPKKEGGTVLLMTERAGDAAVVRIIDDGVGFASGESADEPHTSIGLRSAEERLKYMVGGSLTVESESGKGSTITIRIPLNTKEEP